MRRRGSDLEPSRFGSLMVLLMGLVSISVVFIFMSLAYKPPTVQPPSPRIELVTHVDGSYVSSGENLDRGADCCKGVQGMELWGAAVKWGSDFKVSSAEECCRACRDMCPAKDGPCLCNSWVFCGDRDECGTKYGECWLKKQKDVTAPEKSESGMWTSGLIFGKEEGIIGMETEYGGLRIKLFPECAPRSVAYVLEVLAHSNCAGCHFYRAESRGKSWDAEGNHIIDASYGPPFALIQGILEYDGPGLENSPEHCPGIRRGSVAWVGSGSEFFISLANHQEWRKPYTVFGSLLPEDIAVAERIAQLPTKPDVWGNSTVRLLENVVPLKMKGV